MFQQISSAHSASKPAGTLKLTPCGKRAENEGCLRDTDHMLGAVGRGDTARAAAGSPAVTSSPATFPTVSRGKALSSSRGTGAA